MEEPIRTQLWIEGRAVLPETGEAFPVLDPATGDVIGHAARGQAADVDRAVETIKIAARTGNPGDGKVFVTPLVESRTIRTRSTESP